MVARLQGGSKLLLGTLALLSKLAPLLWGRLHASKPPNKSTLGVRSATLYSSCVSAPQGALLWCCVDLIRFDGQVASVVDHAA